jgi:hypothetical protein
MVADTTTTTPAGTPTTSTEPAVTTSTTTSTTTTTIVLNHRTKEFYWNEDCSGNGVTCYHGVAYVSATIGSNLKIDGVGTGIPFIKLFLGRYPAGSFPSRSITLCADQLQIQQGDAVLSPVPHVNWRALSIAHWEDDCLVVPPSTDPALGGWDWGPWFWIDLTDSGIDWSLPVTIHYYNRRWFDQPL